MNDRSFHLEINNFQDFVTFVAIIRGKELDTEELKSLVQSLKVGEETLKTAVDNNQET